MARERSMSDVCEVLELASRFTASIGYASHVKYVPCHLHLLMV